MFSEGQRDPWQDRRALLDYALKDFVRRGGRLNTPPKTPYNDPALLDSVDVPALLRALPQTTVPVDLAKFTSKGSTSDNSSDNPFASRPTGGKNPFLQQQQTGPVDVDSIPTYTFQPSSGVGNGVGREDSNPFMNERPSAGANPFLEPTGPSSKTSTPQPGGTPTRYTTNNGQNPFGQQAPNSNPFNQPPVNQHPYSQTAPAGQKPVTSKPHHARISSAPQPPVPQLDEDDGSVSEVDAGLSLSLGQLETGLPEEQLRELAYLIFVAACPVNSTPATLPPRPGRGNAAPLGGAMGIQLAVRQQLGLDETQARDVASVLRHVSTGYWTPQRRCSLEGLMTLLAQARPADFNMLGGGSKGFRGWVRWRHSLSSVMSAAAELKHAALQHSPQSKKLVARLRGALRRLNVTTPDEFDDEEYSEAAAAMKDAVRGLAFCSLSSSGAGNDAGGLGNGWANFDSASGQQQPFPEGTAAGLLAGSGRMSETSGAGWWLPWAMRARIAEILLGALFDVTQDGAYIDDMSGVQAALDSNVWPALGVSSTLTLALSAWTHFRQYLRTQQPWLARQLKSLMTKLSAVVVPQRVERTRSSRNRSPNQAPAIRPLTLEDENEADSAVAAEVGRLIVESLADRLSDYHENFPRGQEQAFQVMLDTTVSAAKARGDSDAQLAGMLVGVVNAAVEAQWRRLQAHRRDVSSTVEEHLLVSLSCAEEVDQVESALYGPALQPHLPQQPAVVAARLHRAVGDQLLPWLRSGLSLSPACLDVVKTAVSFDELLGSRVQEVQQLLAKEDFLRQAQQPGGMYAGAAAIAAGSEDGGAGTVVAAALKGFMRWELSIPIQQALEKWVANRVSAMTTWVDRQLSTEKWAAVNTRDGCSQSSVEVVAMVLEAVEALLSMGLPVGKTSLSSLLHGIDSAFVRYASHIASLLGPPNRLIPSNPPVTRYKKPYVVKQEEVEMDLLAASTPGLVQKPAKERGAMATLKGIGRSILSTTPTSKNGKAGNGNGQDDPEGFLSSVPPIQSHPEFNALKARTPAVIACYIMSAHHLSKKTDQVVAVVEERWKPAAPDQDDKSWVTSCFMSSQQSLSRVCDEAMVFLATKVVFWDMRYGWLEQLYRHHVASKSGSAMMPPYSCRIEPLLQGLNQVLSEACSSLPDDLRAQLATELLTAAAQAWQRVILDGGPCRWFIPADVPALREDLDALQGLFEAEGEGLPRDVTEPIIRPCKRLLLLVGCELGQLMNMLKQARLHGRATLNRAGVEPEVFDEYVLLRMVARRPERSGSKMLKKDYKMSRRVKG